MPGGPPSSVPLLEGGALPEPPAPGAAPAPAPCGSVLPSPKGLAPILSGFMDGYSDMLLAGPTDAGPSSPALLLPPLPPSGAVSGAFSSPSLGSFGRPHDSFRRRPLMSSLLLSSAAAFSAASRVV